MTSIVERLRQGHYPPQPKMDEAAALLEEAESLLSDNLRGLWHEGRVEAWLAKVRGEQP